MRSVWKDIVTALFIGMIFPGILLNVRVFCEDGAQVQETAEETAPAVIRVLVTGEDGAVAEMDMDTYLTGVVLAEMPASFAEDALKAQAVVARTYSRKAWETGGKHGNGSVCTESACCQGFMGDAVYLSRGGTAESLEKVREAVAATSGEVLTYGGELIEATYFSCSGGSTEDAAAVWGQEYPYLQAVSSPGEENAVYFTDTVCFTAEEFQQALGTELAGSPGSWFGAVTYTDGGGVETIFIGERSYSGTQLRQLLGLRSTAFVIAAEENAVTVTTRGYGHRVGMSQYGADAMAAQGMNYGQILAHYYPGTELVDLRQGGT